MDALLPPNSQRPTELHEAMRYSALAPGKRLRPALVCASAEAIAKKSVENIPGILDAACAVEFVHCFSLIHDDLPAIDNDDLRRGLPTAHVKFGEGIALLAGDALFALAFEVLSNCGADPVATLRAVQELATATGSDGLVGGEVMDVLTEGKSFNQEDVEFIHSRKTGVLIRVCCVIGGLLAGANQDQIKRLSEYGSQIGLAFQIADDILNETGTAEQLGKATGTDSVRKKATYPALFGIERSQEQAVNHANTAIEALGDLATPELKNLAGFSVQRFH